VCSGRERGEVASELRRIVSASLSILLLLGLILNYMPLVETFSSPRDKVMENGAYVDLNALMFDEFQKWDTMLTRYISINGSLTEYYDYSRAPDYSKPTLASAMIYSDALISFYEAFNYGYYLSKLRTMIDSLIEESGPNGFYTFDSYKGEIFYVWTYRYNVPPEKEVEFSALYTMPAGVSAAWLYLKTGELKYKNLADRIARESLGFAVVNNATDMGWRSTYCFNGTEADAKIGVNMLGCIAQFYSVYGKYINSTYASYIPKIINWIWRAQLASGGLSYDIGGTVEAKYYTAFVFWYALKAYQTVPEQFSEDLQTKLNKTLTYLLKVSGGQFSAENYFITADLVLAVKSGLIAFPASDYLEKTKTYVYGSLMLARYAEKGFDIALNDYSIGYRFQGSPMVAFFSNYPLPDNLKVFLSPKISFEEYRTGSYHWQGWAISTAPPMYVGDIYGQTGWAPHPFTILVSYKGGAVTRNVTEHGYYFQAWSNYTDAKVLTYFYPTTVMFGNVTGLSRIFISSAFPTTYKPRLRAENGTIYNLEIMNNGTKVLSNDFLLWQNQTDPRSRYTIFVHSPKTNTYNFTRLPDRIMMTSDISNYNMTASYLSGWVNISTPDDAFSLMRNITSAYHSATPLTLTSILNHYKGLMESKSPVASWWDAYKNSVSTGVKLVAHNSPEKVSLGSWEFANNRLSFIVLAPLETTSTTKVYCGVKGEPVRVNASSGILTWSYNVSTMILTLNIVHAGPAKIVVEWRIPIADLNALMLEEFQKWDAILTRYLSINGTITDPWDFSRGANGWDKITLSGASYYILGLISFYASTGNRYYLNKLRTIIDAFIDNNWFRVTTDKGTIFYIEGYWFDNHEIDPSCLLTAIAGVASIKLYQWTGEAKYKNLADQIAAESLKFQAVNNSTDMAWVPGYYTTPRDEATAKIGVNRQGSLAYFYSLYNQYNSTFGSSVPKILNWMWRAQVSNGGLGYNIGDSAAGGEYTAFSLFFAFNSYQNVPQQFGETLMTKINNSLTWLSEKVGSTIYLANWIYSAALSMAVKSNFLSSPSQTFLDITKTYLYYNLNLMHPSERGLTVSLSDYPFGYRWQQLFVGAMFSLYPLPANLATFTNPKINLNNFTTGRYYWQGWSLELQGNTLFVGDIYGNIGWYQYPYYLLQKKSGSLTRSVTELDGSFKAWANYTDAKILTYYYPTGVIFTNVTGLSQAMVLSDITSNARLRVENGTEYNLETMSNGTKVLSNNFMVWRNDTSKASRSTAFVRCLKRNTWVFTRYSSTYKFTADLTDYNITIAYLNRWSGFSGSDDVFFLLKNMAIQHESLSPLSSAQILNIYKTFVQTRNPLPSWWNAFKNSVSTYVKLVVHNNPEKVSLMNWEFANQHLTFTVSAPSGTTSISKVYCGDKGEPMTVCTSNGTLAWSYNASTTILTLNVVHASPASILVDWRIPGDVNGDNKVDASDLFDLSKAYGSESSKPNWNPDCDFNWDGKIDTSDLFNLSKNYGKTKL